MKPAKYIVLNDHGVEVAYIFPSGYSHAYMVATLQSDIDTAQPVAAGFTIKDGDIILCYGGSESTGLKSRYEDEALVRATYDKIFMRDSIGHEKN